MSPPDQRYRSGFSWRSVLAMCARREPQGNDQYPNRWDRDFESLSEIYGFAYGNLQEIVIQALHQKSCKEFLRDRYQRHAQAYRETISYYFDQESREHRQALRAERRQQHH